MKLLLNGLEEVKGQIEVETIDEQFNLSLSGSFKIKRGIFEQICWWNCELYVKYNNVIYIENQEIDDITDVKLGELPIDNLHDFKKSLINSGLTSVSNSLGFSDDEMKKALFESVKNHREFKRIYGKKATIWNLLTQDEQKLIELKHICENFNTCGANIKKVVAKYYGIDTDLDPEDENNYITIEPTLEMFQAKLVQLAK